VIIQRVFRSSRFGAGSFFWQSPILAKSGFPNRLIFFCQSFGKFGSGWFGEIHFSGKVIFFNKQGFCFASVLVKIGSHLVSRFLKQFRFGSSSFVFD